MNTLYHFDFSFIPVVTSRAGGGKIIFFSLTYMWSEQHETYEDLWKKKSILINISWLINLTRGSNIPNECHYWSEPAMESYRVFPPQICFFITIKIENYFIRYVWCKNNDKRNTSITVKYLKCSSPSQISVT